MWYYYLGIMLIITALATLGVVKYFEYRESQKKE